MRVAQILNDIVHYITDYEHLSDIPEGTYPPDIQLAEVEDYVHYGWGYLNGHAIEPTPPEGWLYDRDTGTFYPKDEPKPVPETPAIERIAAAVEFQTVSMMPDGGDDFYAQTDYDASPEERIAAALEYQTIAAMPDMQ